MKKFQWIGMVFVAAVVMACTGNKTAKDGEADSLATVQSVIEGTVEVSDVEIPQSGVFETQDVEQYWQGSVIPVQGDKADVVTLFEAFNQKWPTVEGNSIVAKTNPSLVKGETYKGRVTIDRENGFVESPYVDDENTPAVQACVWKRKNGHRLFAVHFGMYSDVVPNFACFYDYDPATKTLTPEASPVKKENMLFPDKRPYQYLLPQEGKCMYVREEGSVLCFEDVYAFDGQNLVFKGIYAGGGDMYQEQYEYYDLDDVHETLTKFALIDIDGDGVEEIWARSEHDEDGAIFTIEDEGNPLLLITEAEGKRPSFGKGWVYVGYPAGGPSYFTHIVTVEASTKRHTFSDLQVEERHEYTLDEVDVSEAEGKKFRSSLKGEGKALTPKKWFKMVGMFDFE